MYLYLFALRKIEIIYEIVVMIYLVYSYFRKLLHAYYSARGKKSTPKTKTKQENLKLWKKKRL